MMQHAKNKNIHRFYRFKQQFTVLRIFQIFHSSVANRLKFNQLYHLNIFEYACASLLKDYIIYIGEWPQELMRCLKGMSRYVNTIAHPERHLLCLIKRTQKSFLGQPGPWHPHAGLKKRAHEVQTLLPKALSKL